MNPHIFIDEHNNMRLLPPEILSKIDAAPTNFDLYLEVQEGKSNSLPVVNPEIVPFTMEKGKLYEWPGTWEETQLEYTYSTHKGGSSIGAKLIAPNASEGADATQQQQLQRGKFYWIKIQHWDMNNRLPDKWSIAQWDANSFEELNEMYRVEDVIEIGPMIPTPEEITRWYNTQPKQL